MISRPPPPRGYKYNPVNGKLEKKTKGVKPVGRGHGRRHNKKRKKKERRPRVYIYIMYIYKL